MVLEADHPVPEHGHVALDLDVDEEDAGEREDEEGDEPVQVEGEEEAGQRAQQRREPVCVCGWGFGVWLLDWRVCERRGDRQVLEAGHSVPCSDAPAVVGEGRPPGVEPQGGLEEAGKVHAGVHRQEAHSCIWNCSL